MFNSNGNCTCDVTVTDVSNDNSGSIGWGTILSLVYNFASTIVIAGLAYKASKTEKIAVHRIEATNDVTDIIDGKTHTEHRVVTAEIVASDYSEVQSFTLNTKNEQPTGKAKNETANATTDSKSVDDLTKLPTSHSLKSLGIKLAIDGATEATTAATPQARQTALEQVAILVADPTATLTAALLKAKQSDASSGASITAIKVTTGSEAKTTSHSDSSTPTTNPMAVVASPAAHTVASYLSESGIALNGEEGDSAAYTYFGS